MTLKRGKKLSIRPEKLTNYPLDLDYIVTRTISRHTPLFNAVSTKQHNLAKKMLELGSDPNGASFSLTTPLMIAASNNDLEMVV